MLTRKQKVNEVITIVKGNQKLTLYREDNHIILAETEFPPLGGRTAISAQTLTDIADVLNMAVVELKKYPMKEIEEAAHE